MHAEVENITEKLITGISARTTNKKEMNPLTGQIPGLCQKFDESVEVDYKNGGRVYSVYFDYESDATEEYTILVGTDQQNPATSLSLQTVAIQAGKYLVFHARGEVPKVVIDTWGEIWAYFSQEGANYRRLFTTDFEYYVNQNEVKIYIAVE